MPKVLIVGDDEIIAQGMVRHLAQALDVGSGTRRDSAPELARRTAGGGR